MNSHEYRQLRRRVLNTGKTTIEEAAEDCPPPDEVDPEDLERLAEAVADVKAGKAAAEVEREARTEQKRARARAAQENRRLDKLKKGEPVALS